MLTGSSGLTWSSGSVWSRWFRRPNKMAVPRSPLRSSVPVVTGKAVRGERTDNARAYEMRYALVGPDAISAPGLPATPPHGARVWL